jgi:anti-sigma factor RsiW
MSESRIEHEHLVDFVSGDLDAARREVVEQAIAADPRVAETVRHLRRTLTVIGEDDTRRPTAGALRRAVALFETSPPNAMVAWLERVQREVARVVFDSHAEPALAGFRGELETRQLSYESDVARIDLQVVPQEPDDRLDGAFRARLRGQVTPAPEHVAGMIIAAPSEHGVDDDVLTAGEPDAHGQFLITVDAGRYAVHFEFDDGAHAVTLPDLDIP